MSDENERKASDILLSIEKKIDTLLKVCQNFDFTNKLILANTNKLLAGLSEPSITPAVNKDLPEVIRSQPPIIEVAKDMKPMRKTSRTNELVIKQDSETKSESKVAVIQKVKTPANKDIFMADVLISDMSHNILQKIKTNSLGKWQAHLSAGDYIVTIIKTDSTTKQEIQSIQNITVDGKSATMKLPDHIHTK